MAQKNNQNLCYQRRCLGSKSTKVAFPAGAPESAPQTLLLAWYWGPLRSEEEGSGKRREGRAEEGQKERKGTTKTAIKYRTLLHWVGQRHIYKLHTYIHLFDNKGPTGL